MILRYTTLMNGELPVFYTSKMVRYTVAEFSLTGKELVDKLIETRLSGKEWCYVWQRGYVDDRFCLAIEASDVVDVSDRWWDSPPEWLQRAWNYKEVSVQDAYDEENDRTCR